MAVARWILTLHVQLETKVPIISLVLTPHHFHDHAEHRNYFHQHFVVKAADSPRVQPL